ncbi:MAG: hypothetical protein K6T85_06190 [Gorillibacterium sp.]|nr:hypothetical protein [Gorillibacterium sp.]
MSSLANPEALLQTFNIQYDPKLLASHRITFALLLRKYLAQSNCLDEELVAGFAGENDLSRQTGSLIRLSLENAWAEFETGEQWKGYLGGESCSPKSCGPCKSSCGENDVSLNEREGRN